MFPANTNGGGCASTRPPGLLEIDKKEGFSMKKRIFAILLALELVPTAAFAADEDDFTIKKGVLTGYTGAGGNVVIPESVTVIGDNVFENCPGLTSVTFPSRLSAIGKGAFKGCVSLSGITLPNSVVSLGDEAFCGCTGLGSVTLSRNLKAIPAHGFAGCTGIGNMVFPASVSSIWCMVL